MEEYFINLRMKIALSPEQADYLLKLNCPEISQILIEGINKELRQTAPVLSPIVDTIELKMKPGLFIARHNFIVQAGDKKRPKIVDLSDDFRRNFINKTEELSVASCLYSRELRRNANDDEIIKALPVPPRHKSFLAQLYALLQKQSQGQPGHLTVDGTANIFFIENIHGKIQAVRVLWSKGWLIDSLPLDCAYWLKGRKVFSN